VARLDRRLGEVPGEGLANATCAPLAKGDLNGGIAVPLGRLDLRDPVVGDVEHRHREGVALVSEDAHHADLAADQSYRHNVLICFLVTPVCAGGRLRWAGKFQRNCRSAIQLPVIEP
jgi:hypothetical protein